MSRRQYFTVERNAVAVDVLSGVVRHRPSAASRAELVLAPDALDAIGLSATDVYTVRLVEETDAATLIRTVIFRGTIPREASYAARFTPPEGSRAGETLATRTLTLQDRLWAFADVAPAATITHRRTDLESELAFLSSVLAVPAVTTTTPNVLIDRVDYTRDGGYWGALWPYMAPWEPVVFVDPTDGAILVVDTSALADSLPVSNRTLTASDWNDLSARASVGPVETQYAVTSHTAGGAEEESPALVGTVTDSTTTTNDDGSRTVDWTEDAELHEDLNDPTKVTRTVRTADGQTWIAADDRVLSDKRTEILYRDNYTLVRKTTTTEKAWVTLPDVGDTFIQAETTVEDRDYDPHPTLPNRVVLKRVRRLTSGLYVWTDTGGDAEQQAADIKETGAAVKELSWNGAVDTQGTGSLRWASGPLLRYTETWNRTAGRNQVAVSFQEIDVLRDRERRSGHRTELGDTTADPTSFARVDYVGTAGKTAKPIDATKIGRELGLEIARRRLARAGAATTELDLRLCRPNYAQYRLGWVVVLDSTVPYGLAGKALATGVDLTLNPATPGTAAVEQRLQLVRAW